LATFAAPALQVAMQRPARRSQGCEVARVLNLLDTARPFQFPPIRLGVTPPVSFFRFQHCNLSPFLRICTSDVDPFSWPLCGHTQVDR